jgi:CBS domain-containing protein
MTRIAVALVWIGICLFAASTSTQAASSTLAGSQRYHDEENGFSIAMPRGWVTVPRSVIDDFSQKTLTPEARRKTTVALGMQLKTRQWLEHPYVLVQITPYDVARQPRVSEMKRIVKEITGADLEEAVSKVVKEEVKDKLTNMTTDRIEFNEKERRFVWECRMTVAGVAVVKGYAVGYFGRRHLILVACYALENEFTSWKPSFDGILAAFRLDPKMQYEEIEWYESRGLAIGLLVGVGVVLAAVFRRK